MKYDSSTLSVKFFKVPLNVICPVMSPLRYSNFFYCSPLHKNPHYSFKDFTLYYITMRPFLCEYSHNYIVIH